MLRRREFLSGLAAGVVSGCSSSVDAPYPSKEIKLIVQASPGGLSDTVSRVTASLMEKQLGVPVVCENKPGAAGALAFSFVTRRPPDGYTIGHGPVEIAMVRTLGFADVGPDNMDLLCLVTKSQPALAVHVESPWQTFEEFVSGVRQKPSHYVIANSGTGSIWHVNSLLLERATGLRFIHCPFSGSSGALTALLGQHVDAAVAGVGEMAAHVEAGRMRALAVFDDNRSTLYPDVPATGELGYDFGANAWSGFYAPQGLPSDRTGKLVASIKEAASTETFARLCAERGMEPAFLGAEEFRRFAVEQAAFFASAIPDLLGGSQ